MEKRNIEEMSDHELLMELIAEKRRNDRLRYIRYGIIAAVALFVIIELSIWLPKINAALDTYYSLVNEVQSTTDSLKNFVGKIDLSILNDLQDKMGDVDKMMGNVEEVLGKLKGILGMFGMN